MARLKHCPSTHVSQDVGINMRVQDQAKNPLKRAMLSIAPIHLGLSIAENWIRNDNPQGLGNQNLVAADISFEISLGNHNGRHKRGFITFPIKIPGKDLYTITEAFRDVGQEIVTQSGNQALAVNHTYRLMQERYEKGHELIGPNHCGHRPLFQDVQTDKQYTHHSEQALYSYLATQAGVEMLTSRLIAEIRGRNIATIGDTIKVYAVGLHIHSTKTPCGPCERGTVGLQNTQTHRQGQSAQFIELLMAELLNRSAAPTPEQRLSPVNFTYPGHRKPVEAAKLGPTMFTTYTANTHDADHRTTRPSQPVVLSRQDAAARSRVFVCNYGFEFDEGYLARHEPDLTCRTIFASASAENKHTPVSKSRIKKVSEEEEGKSVSAVRRLFEGLSTKGKGKE